MALTDKQIRDAVARDKDYKLYDGGGLLLRVRKTGSKCWEVKYRVTVGTKRVEKALSLGTYPLVSLKEAREKNREAQRLRAEFKDPAVERARQKRAAEMAASHTFQVVALEWYNKHLPLWTPRHGKKLWRRIELHLLPTLGKRPIAEIAPLEVLAPITALENQNKTETTHRLLQDCSGIFAHAILTERAKFNPARELKGGLRRHTPKNMPSIEEKQLPGFLKALSQVETAETIRLAMGLLMMTFVRTGELRKSKKAHFNLKERIWEVNAEDMKMRRNHVVPLSRQAVSILKKLLSLTGDSEFLLPNLFNSKHPVMSENTINAVIHDMGFKGKMVGHGFRSLASTILNKHGFDEKIVDLQLAHAARNKVSVAYNRYKYLEERKQMMQWWSDYLEKAGLLKALQTRK